MGATCHFYGVILENILELRQLKVAALFFVPLCRLRVEWGVLD